MKAAIALLIAGLLAGCEQKPTYTWEPDQTVRAERFDTCLRLLPAGPQATKYNDWAEVVEACADAAYRQSVRKVAVE